MVSIKFCHFHSLVLFSCAPSQSLFLLFCFFIFILLHCFLIHIICLSCVALLLSFAVAVANLNALALFSFSLWYFYFGLFLFAIQQPFCFAFFISPSISYFPTHISVSMLALPWSVRKKIPQNYRKITKKWNSLALKLAHTSHLLNAYRNFDTVTSPALLLKNDTKAEFFIAFLTPLKYFCHIS